MTQNPDAVKEKASKSDYIKTKQKLSPGKITPWTKSKNKWQTENISNNRHHRKTDTISITLMDTEMSG